MYANEHFVYLFSSIEYLYLSSYIQIYFQHNEIMKKIKILLLVAFFNTLIFSSFAATVWPIAAGNNPYTAYSNAGFNSGDIIELTTSGGAYTWSTKISTLSKSFTLRAAAGLAIKPIVTLPIGVFIGTSNNTDAQTVTLSGIEFDGNAGCTSISTPKAAAGGSFNISVSDCVFRNFAAATKFFAYSASGTGWAAAAQWYGSLIVSNCKFLRPFTSVAYYSTSYGGASVTSFTNCYIEGGTATVLGNLAGNANTTTSFTVDHCTLNNAGGATGSEFNVKNGGTSTTIVKNSIFTNNPGGVASNVIAAGVNPGNAANLNNGVFYSGTTPLIGTKYPTALLGSYLTTDPMLDTDGFATATDYLSGPTDSKPRGFYNTSTLPWISLSNDSILQMGYNGIGPVDAAQTFKVGGINLSAGITVTPSSNFEISLDGNSFSTTPILLNPLANKVNTTTIYVRLVASLSPLDYTGSITLTSADATTKTVALKGMVTVPTITLSSYALGQYDYFTGLGPSPEQLVTINATTLKGDLTVTAPANFEMSTTSGTAFSTNAIVLTPNGTGAIVNQALYVRMVTGLSPGIYSGNVTYTSTGAATKTTSVVGGVSNQPTMSVSNYYGLNYILANGPSVQQKIVVEGGGLTDDILISLPINSNFEISTSEGVLFTPTNPITLSQTGGIVIFTPIYLRLKAGLGIGNYNDILTLNSVGSNTISAVINGNVTSSPNSAPRNEYTSNPSVLKVLGNAPTKNNQEKKRVTLIKVIVQ